MTGLGTGGGRSPSTSSSELEMSFSSSCLLGASNCAVPVAMTDTTATPPAEYSVRELGALKKL